MSQSSVIAFFLLAGFLAYITMKGELVKYAGVIGIGPNSGDSQNSSSSTSSTLAALAPLVDIGIT